MSEADGNSFGYNKRHGLIWKDTNGTYQPVITIGRCAVCGYEDNVDNLIEVGDFRVCSEKCRKEWEQ